MLRRYRHVVWDWNGTLLDDATLCVSVMDALLRSRGLPGLERERYAATFRFPVRDYYAEIGFDFGREPFEEVGRAFIEAYQAGEHACGLRLGAADVLAEVEARGLGQSVLSASQQWRLEGQARRLGVDRHFGALVGLDDHHAHGKVDTGRAWIAQSGLDPREVLLVGDTDHDAEVARALGIDVVLVPSGHQAEARLRASGAGVVHELTALID